jgi:O-methyltransferase
MAVSKTIFRTLAKWLGSKHIYLTRSLSFRQRTQALPPNFDYVRYATLGLCYEEIVSRNVQGNVAELGVFKGDFAARLNQLFPDRKLYLFDTFEGFNEKDITTEHQKGFSGGEQDFSKTSIEHVHSRMAYPNNCIFKKGYFPDTATGIDDQFCFVSLDADLYAPMREGLKFFYPRLSTGGYIFIHDFNNDQYKGVRQAVTEFCNSNNISYTPIPDNGGSVVIVK